MAGAALPAAIPENRAGGHVDENDEGLSGSNQAGQRVLEGVELKPD